MLNRPRLPSTCLDQSATAATATKRGGIVRERATPRKANDPPGSLRAGLKKPSGLGPLGQVERSAERFAGCVPVVGASIGWSKPFLGDRSRFYKSRRGGWEQRRS